MRDWRQTQGEDVSESAAEENVSVEEVESNIG